MLDSFSENAIASWIGSKENLKATTRTRDEGEEE